MLTSFTVENFRLFQQFNIAPFARVNLLVGKNNSGKSALLEALEVYASNASLVTLRSLMADREETWNERGLPDSPMSADIPVRHLFRGHYLPEIGKPGIQIGPIGDPSKQIQLLTAAFQRVTNEDGVALRRMLSSSEAAELQGDDDVEEALIAVEGEKVRRILRLDQQSVAMRSMRSGVDVDPKFPFQVVPTRNMTAQKIAALWDLIGLTPLAEEVIAGLRLMDSSIAGILFVASRGEARMPLVSSSKAPEPLPLKSMGDGMTRLFHIVVALVNAKDGLLLIDEFENGLHWSVQQAVWQTVFRLASHLNVQVFATTHSRDCVASFEAAWVSESDAGAFFRLQLDTDGSPRVKAYNLDTLADSLDTDVEVR